ncbi:MAG: response regulator [Rhodocyclaceae bacterium]|nr:MAG: response regulator [Rhodocyclaceae bacterium]
MIPSIPHFLVVEDDPVFSRVLTRSLRGRGFTVDLATCAEEALTSARAQTPDYVILDLKLGQGSSLPLIKPLIELGSAMRICLLTGFAGIATAVEAIKLGAHYYLAKPAHVDEILAALDVPTRKSVGVPARKSLKLTAPHALDELEWRHIMQTLRDCGGNVSQAARLLNMHRRTLQRKIVVRGGQGAAESIARFRVRASRAVANAGGNSSGN